MAASGWHVESSFSTNTWKAALQKGSKGPDGHQVDHEAATCPHGKAPGLNLSEQRQLVWGGDTSTPHCTGEATPAVLGAVTGSPVQD